LDKETFALGLVEVAGALDPMTGVKNDSGERYRPSFRSRNTRHAIAVSRAFPGIVTVDRMLGAIPLLNRIVMAMMLMETLMLGRRN